MTLQRIELSRDPDTGALQTPFVAATNERASRLARQRGVPVEQCRVDAQHQIEAEQPDLIEQHLRLMNAGTHGGPHFKALPLREQFAFESMERAERLAEFRESRIERFASTGDPFEDEIARRMGYDTGDPVRYAEAMEQVAAERPDLARAYAERLRA